MLLGKTIVVTGISSGIGARVGELAQAFGADVIGVDINEPKRPLDAFIKADIGSAQGVAEIVETLPRRFDALCNVAGVSGMIGAAKTLAINFYGLRELSEAVAPRLREGGAVVNVASIAGYGWRANLERAKAFVAAPGFPDSWPTPGRSQGPRRRGLSAVEGASALVDDAGGSSAFVQGEGRAGECGEPRPGDDADPQGVSFNLRRSQGRRRHRPRRPRRLGARHRAPCALPVLGRGALDQRRQSAGRRRPRSLNQRDGSRVLTSAGHCPAGRSTERLVVDAKVADAFVDKLAERAAALPSSDPRGPVVLGSLVNIGAAERMDELIADAVARAPRWWPEVSAAERLSTRRSSTRNNYRLTPPLMFGAEADYDRAYSGLVPGGFDGQAVYLGPTFHYQINDKIDLSAAVLLQTPAGRLDYVEFPRQLAKLRLEVEF